MPSRTMLLLADRRRLACSVFLLLLSSQLLADNCVWASALDIDSTPEQQQRDKLSFPSSSSSSSSSSLQQQHQQQHYSDSSSVRRTTSTSSGTTRRVMVEGVQEPLFRCPECADALRREQAAILAEVQRLVPDAQLAVQLETVSNLLVFVVPSTSDEDDDRLDRSLEALPGVLAVSTDPILPLDQANGAQISARVGATISRDTYCLQGETIRVAVLDSGIDYTHVDLGGSGTNYAAAYGTSITSIENTRRDGLFPTTRVREGWDYVGDISLDSPSEDEDPIDQLRGHGTAVASAVLTVAPEVDLYAYKVCIDTGCLGSAIMQGINRALDPFPNNNLNDRVDIINLSLGSNYVTAFYSSVVRTLQTAFDLGVVAVVSAGNNGNIPFTIGQVSAMPSAITVGATGPIDDPVDAAASYTSRGPGDFNLIKPDLSAPGTEIILANGGTGRFSLVFSGTSFSCPIVAGLAALLIQRCPTCSPFAIKSLLVNNVNRNIQYTPDFGSNLLAPISLVGAGQVNILRSLESDFWAYSEQDVQPTISLGLVNAAKNTTIVRVIRIVNLSDQEQSVDVKAVFRDPEDEASGGVLISFSQTTVVLPASNTCNGEVTVEVTFDIVASNVPANHMVGGGRGAHEFERLDINEYDGWILLTSSANDISLPFHGILRQAAQVSLGTSTLPGFLTDSLDVTIDMQNTGAGPAQVNVYQLLHISEDDEEQQRGRDQPPVDFRYIGYRFEEGDTCDIIEFAFVIWEGKRTPTNSQFQTFISLNGNPRDFDFILADRGPHNPGMLYNECRILSPTVGVWECAGFAPDHSTNSVNTVTRACINDLGITRDTPFSVAFAAAARPGAGTDGTRTMEIQVPPYLSAGSFDVEPGETWNTLTVNRNGAGLADSALGILLLTDSFRAPDSTGAATLNTEAFALVFAGTTLPEEQTVHDVAHPNPQNLEGPGCAWSDVPASCPATRRLRVQPSFPILDPSSDDGVVPMNSSRRRLEEFDVCPEATLLLADLVTRSPTFSPTDRPSDAPSQPPTLGPTYSPTVTAAPSPSPSEGPTSEPTTGFPTGFPTLSPTSVPTRSAPPSASPTEMPTFAPTPTVQGLLPPAVTPVFFRSSGAMDHSRCHVSWWGLAVALVLVAVV